MEIARMKWNKSGFGFFTGFLVLCCSGRKEIASLKFHGINFVVQLKFPFKLFSKEKSGQNSNLKFTDSH
jgi:hypothetical protein